VADKNTGEQRGGVGQQANCIGAKPPQSKVKSATEVQKLAKKPN